MQSMEVTRHVYSLSALMFPSLHKQTRSKHGRTLRWGCVVPTVFTSRPLRHPSTHHDSLAGLIRLELRLPSPECDGGSRASGPRLLSLSPHTNDHTPGPRQVHMPFPSPVGSGLPSRCRRSACSPPCGGFLPPPDSPSNRRPASSHEAASFALCFGLRVWLAPLAGYDPWVGLP